MPPNALFSGLTFQVSSFSKMNFFITGTDTDAGKTFVTALLTRSLRKAGFDTVAMKPISTLMRPLGTVDVATGQAALAVAERSDVTAVPAMGVIAEAMAAVVLADALLEKFGGDSLNEVRRNLDAYLARLDERLG